MTHRPLSEREAWQIALQFLTSIDCWDDKAQKYVGMAVVRLKMLIAKAETGQ